MGKLLREDGHQQRVKTKQSVVLRGSPYFAVEALLIPPLILYGNFAKLFFISDGEVAHRSA